MKGFKKYLSIAFFSGLFFPGLAQESPRYTVPLGGNSWLTTRAKNGHETVDTSGWKNWENPQAVFSTFVRVAQAGELKISAVFRVPDGISRLRCRIGNQSKIVSVSAGDSETEIGTWQINKAGYVRIDMQGLSRTGKIYADVRELVLSGPAANDSLAYVKNNRDNYFYWGRRGPSVHINYDLYGINEDILWFYNEVTVPAGNDITGSFFMANGFAEGYFGMQVNSPTERRILFSVWSPFDTNDPALIPEDKRVKLLQKGYGVHAGDFGNEGSGGQSYLVYPWKAGTTYKFLLQATPVENNSTRFSAFFYAPEKQRWMLIARFLRPGAGTYLKRLHSFLESFEPETGNITRKAWYQHAWVRTVKGEWKPLNKMLFTGDLTAQKRYRMDYAGGVENGKFYLQNGGFFNRFTPLRSVFSLPPATAAPVIPLLQLEKEDYK